MTNKIIISGFVALVFVAGSLMTNSAYAQVDPIQQLQIAVVQLRDAVLQNAQTIEGEIGARILNDQNQQAQIDSFFDVFTEISVHNEDVDRLDGHVTVLKEQADGFDTEMVALSLRSDQGDADLQSQIDSFFDVFTEISVHDADVSRIDTEILSMDLRGESCSVGDVVTGVDSLGNLVCATVSGSGPVSWTELNDVPAGFADDVDNVNDADNDPTNEINPQLGGTRDLGGSLGGSVQVDCLLGEVKLFGGNFAPRGFVAAEGQLLQISQNQSLFSIFGTTFGGDGRTTFALPDLRDVEPNSSGIGTNDDVNYLVCTNGIFPSRN